MTSTFVITGKNAIMQDDFSGTTLDTSLWSSSGSGVSVSDGLRLTTDLSPSSKGIASTGSFDLTGHFASCELSNVPATLTSLQFFLQVIVDSTHRVQWALSQGVLYVNINTGSGDITPSGGSVTFDPVATRFLRIRENSGTTYWEYSADSNNWETFYSQSNPLTLSSITMAISADTYYTESSQVTVVIEHAFIGSDSTLTITAA